MARFAEVIDLQLPPAAAFESVADSARLPEWHPGAVEARRLDAGPLRVGSRFAVAHAFLGRRLALGYEIRRTGAVCARSASTSASSGPGTSASPAARADSASA